MQLKEAYSKIHAYFSKPGAAFGFDREPDLCRFRTEDGRKCAVGVLIPNEIYDPYMEDEELDDLLHDGLHFLLEDLPEEEADDLVRFLRDAQKAHDSRAVGRRWSEDNQSTEKIESSIPLFLQDLDQLAREYGVEVAA